MDVIKLLISVFLITSQIMYGTKPPLPQKNLAQLKSIEEKPLKKSKEVTAKLAAQQKKYEEFLKWTKVITPLQPMKSDLSKEEQQTFLSKEEQQTLIQLYKERYLLAFASYVVNRYDWQLPAQFNLIKKTPIEKIEALDIKRAENSNAIDEILSKRSKTYVEELQKIAFELACQECGNKPLLIQLYN